MEMITNYARVENSCLNRQFYTIGDIWALDEATGEYNRVARGQRILTNMRRIMSGTWDAYPSPASRRDRLAKPIRVRRWGQEYPNDWYIV